MSFKNYLQQYCPELTPAQGIAFEVYYTLLFESNQRFNLTGITDPEESALKHFFDSLTFHQALELQEGSRVIDMGSGAGFPGLVLAIMNPKVEFTLVDAVGKKVAFLTSAIQALNLSNVRALHGRSEVMGQSIKYREAFDVGVARSVAYLPTLSEYLLPFIRVGGWMVVAKEAPFHVELEASAMALSLLGGEYRRATTYLLPRYKNERCILFFSKVYSTPEKYPRRDGVPLKYPL